MNYLVYLLIEALYFQATLDNSVNALTPLGTLFLFACTKIFASCTEVVNLT